MLPDRSLTVARMPFPERSHNAAIDGLRALAVLAVIVFHANAAWLPGGFTGVDLFFVVAGFVISQSLAARAGVPLGLAYFDYADRVVGVDCFMQLSGDVDADVAAIEHRLGHRRGRKPHLAAPVKLPPMNKDEAA